MKNLLRTTFNLSVLSVFVLLATKQLLFGYACILCLWLTILLSLVTIRGRAINKFHTSDFWHALLFLILCTPLAFIHLALERGAISRQDIPHRIALKQIHYAILDYAKHHDNRLPDPNAWCDTVIEYTKQNLTNEDALLTKEMFTHHLYGKKTKKGKCYFAFNANLKNENINDLPSDTILIFLSEGEWNQHGTQNIVDKLKEENTEFIYFIKLNGAVYKYPLNRPRLSFFTYSFIPRAAILNWGIAP